MEQVTTGKLTIVGEQNEQTKEILTPEALEFVLALHEKFDARRQELLEARQERQKRLDAGEKLDFLPETKHIREGDWTIAPLPADLQDRRVEITGPVDRKMVINALNSGAKMFMACFEDASAPTWENMISGQINMRDAINKTIEFTQASNGKTYKLNKETAVVTVISALDIMRRAYIVGGSTYRYLEPLLFAGVIYYIMTLVLTFLGKRIEKGMRKSD